MLLVKTKIGKSEIEGIGLFADEFIKKGTKVWQFEPNLDLLFSREEIEKFPEHIQEQLHKYTYLDKVRNKYMLCGDDARFWNHSNDANCDETAENDSTFTKRDIEKGEELTINYNEFYGNISEHPELK